MVSYLTLGEFLDPCNILQGPCEIFPSATSLIWFHTHLPLTHPSFSHLAFIALLQCSALLQACFCFRNMLVYELLVPSAWNTCPPFITTADSSIPSGLCSDLQQRCPSCWHYMTLSSPLSPPPLPLPWPYFHNVSTGLIITRTTTMPCHPYPAFYSPEHLLSSQFFYLLVDVFSLWNVSFLLLDP